MAVRQGEIYMASLDPVFGREMGGFKMRPVLIVSINDLNDNTQLVIVVPGTSMKHEARQRPNAVVVEPDDSNRLAERTLFQCNQIRAIAQGRLNPRPIGQLSRGKFQHVERAIAFCTGLNLERTT
jgi:mRNA-degrading endonuclease toxin of MazEF toxin-antitoxin module